jgi:heme/copper-type cytochrome/quinol oxidase subunit 1
VRRSSAGLLIAFIVSAVLVVGGLVIAATGTQTASFGWYAYQPLAGSVFFPGGATVLSPVTALGWSAVVLGLIAMSAIGGYVLGRRRRPRS